MTFLSNNFHRMNDETWDGKITFHFETHSLEVPKVNDKE